MVNMTQEISMDVSLGVRHQLQFAKMEGEEERNLSWTSPASPASPKNWCPHQLYPLVLKEGSILHSKLSRDMTVSVINSVCGNSAYVTSGVFEREYANVDFYRTRRRIYSIARAIVPDRTATWIISVKRGAGTYCNLSCGCIMWRYCY